MRITLDGNIPGAAVPAIVLQWNEPCDPIPPTVVQVLEEGTGTVPKGGDATFTFNDAAGQLVEIFIDGDESGPGEANPDVTFVGCFFEQNLFSNRPVESGFLPGITLQMVIARGQYAAGQKQERGGSNPIYFNRNNRRLAKPEVRQKPDVAAMDGGNTTGVDPNFFTLWNSGPAKLRDLAIHGSQANPTGRPKGLVLDEREDLGLPFVIGTAKGTDASDVRAVLSHPH